MALIGGARPARQAALARLSAEAGAAKASGKWGIGALLLAGAGATLGGVAIQGFPYEAITAVRDWRRAEESAHISKIMRSVQVGPFGNGIRPYMGMGPNHGNAAGMTLASHYARNGTGIRSAPAGFLGLYAGPGYGDIAAAVGL